MTKNSKFVLSSVAVAISLSLSSVQAQEVNASNADEVAVEQIEVRGMRSSIEKSLQDKRFANSIVDTISAEQLGKFPDQNVAESLQRVTGVAITRSRGGEGQFVTVRGLGEEFNAVTFNNRLIATENAGREFSFDVIASELISEAQVTKSPTAKQGDGSIGGRVNIVSAKPFDRTGFHAAGSLTGQFEELSGETTPKISGVVSNTWDDDTVGLLVSFTHSQRKARTDVAESIGIFPTAAIDANGSFDDPNDNVAAITADARINSFAASVAQQERKRTGATAVFQYAPNDMTKLTFDALYTKYESPSEVFGYSYFPNPDTIFPGTAVVNADNQLVSQTSLPFGTELVGRENKADTDTIAIGFNYDYDSGDKWLVNADFGWSKADGLRDNTGSAAGSGSFFVLGWPDGLFSQTSNGTGVPNITYTGANQVGGEQVPLAQLNADDVRLHFSRNTSAEVSDEVLSLRADFTYQLDTEASLDFGFDYVDREKTNNVFDNTDTQCQFCGYATAIADIAPNLTSNFFTVFDDNFLSGTSANIPRAFPIFDLDVLREVFQIAAGSDGTSALTPSFRPASSNVVQESVLGAYLQGNINGEVGDMAYRMNAGVRLAYTDLTSSGAGAEILSARLIDGNNQAFETQTSARVIDNDYFDVLPTFNLTLDVSDSLVARAAFSKSLTRPTLTDLSTIYAITSINAGAEQIVAGNPELEAVRSNNFDLSLEYYSEDGLTITGALFYKDISDFINNQNLRSPITVNTVTDDRLAGANVGPQTFNFLISSPLNGDSAEIKGLELSAQKLFDNGFGVLGNVTLSDSSATAGNETSDLENISDVSYNASVFYENDGVQARLSANHRGGYLFSTAGEGGLSEFVDDYTQIDFSASYEINENVSVFVDAINLTDENYFRFSEAPGLIETYEENGRRWLAGVRVNF